MKHTEHSKTQLNKFSAANYEKGENDFRKIGQEYEEMNNETRANIDGLLAPESTFPSHDPYFSDPIFLISILMRHTRRRSVRGQIAARTRTPTFGYGSIGRYNHFLNQQPLERVQ